MKKQQKTPPLVSTSPCFFFIISPSPCPCSFLVPSLFPLFVFPLSLFFLVSSLWFFLLSLYNPLFLASDT